MGFPRLQLQTLAMHHESRSAVRWGLMAVCLLAGWAGCDSETGPGVPTVGSTRLVATLTARLDYQRARWECSELFWLTTNATSVRIEPDIGTVEPSGSTRVCVDEITTYTLVVEGPGGTPQPPPSVQLPVAAFHTATLTVEPEKIEFTECATLRWESSLPHSWPGRGEQFWTLEPLGVPVASTGSREVCPVRTTRFDLLHRPFPGLGPGLSGTGGGVRLEVAVDAVARCEGVTVTAAPPRPLFPGFRNVFAGRNTCPEVYEVDISLQVDRADEGMVADFLMPYAIKDWRIRSAGAAGVRHDFTLYWAPYEFVPHSRWPIPPLILRTCPGQAGPVLACTDVSCRTYEDEAAVPPFRPGPILGMFRVRGNPASLELAAEGTTHQILVDYEIYSPLEYEVGLTAWVVLDDPGLRPLLDFRKTRKVRFDPRERVLPVGSSGSGTLVFRMTVLPNEEVQGETRHRIRFGSSKSFDSCPLVVPSDVKLLLTDE